MSSTGRGTKRRKGDYYPTPPWCVEWLLAKLRLRGGHWLEPGAGDGSIIRAVNALRSDVNWTAIELDARRAARMDVVAARVLCQNFLKAAPPDVPFDLALGNPPFTYAEEFVTQGLLFAHEVIFLLRLSFLEALKREPFFARVGMPDAWVLSRRPKFDLRKKGTDSCAYAWMRWTRTPRRTGRIVTLYEPRQRPLRFAA